MKILVYSHGFAPCLGGVETYAMLLAQGLATHDFSSADKIEVTLATATPANGMDDGRLPFRVVRQPRMAEMCSLLREADIVHLAGPVFLPLLFGLLFRKTVVIEHHGYQAVCPNGLLFYEPSKTACPGHFMARRYKKCFGCNASSDGWMRSAKMLAITFPRRWLCKIVAANLPITRHVLGRLQLPNSRVIYYGVPDRKVNGQLFRPESLIRSPVCFAYLGRLVREKGPSILLEAAAQLETKGIDFTLKFIGDGPEREALEKKVKSTDLIRRVRFTGFLVGSALEESIRDVDAIIMPSVMEETAGLSAIEQMMRGKLVIASDIGGVGEVVNGAGLKFPAGDVAALVDCLRTVAESPEIAIAVGQRGRKRALELFTQERMVEDHLRLYSELSQRSSASRDSDAQ
jgi:glycosyltransferase involved in cell wall biosynthesis